VIIQLLQLPYFNKRIVSYRNKNSMDCDIQQTRKVGHTDLVFGVRLGLISRSVHARLQVHVCSGYDLFHPG